MSIPRIFLILALSACCLVATNCSSSAAAMRQPKQPTRVMGNQTVKPGPYKQRSTAAPTAAVQDESGPAVESLATKGKPGAAKAACKAIGASAKYVEANLRPLRLMWNSSNGFCGETSVQMAALTKGVWVSQRQARLLGSAGDITDDVIFDDRTDNTGLYFLLKRLGFDQPGSSYWNKDNQTLTSSSRSQYVGQVQPTSSQYMAWVKRNILAGRPVITAVRVETSRPDVWYDHIVPFYGVCSNATSLHAPLLPTDAVAMSSDYKDEQLRPLKEESFYAEWQKCPWDDTEGEVGCIASDTYNFGIAVGGLAAPVRLYMPSRLVISAWSDGTHPQSEPGEESEAAGNAAMASYILSISGLTPGKTYTTYRLASLPRFKVPQSAEQLASVCAAAGAAGCQSHTFVATRCNTVKHSSQLGKFPANSIQYFLTVLVDTSAARKAADTADSALMEDVSRGSSA